jgi:hypothetical protein
MSVGRLHHGDVQLPGLTEGGSDQEGGRRDREGARWILAACRQPGVDQEQLVLQGSSRGLEGAEEVARREARLTREANGGANQPALQRGRVLQHLPRHDPHGRDIAHADVAVGILVMLVL